MSKYHVGEFKAGDVVYAPDGEEMVIGPNVAEAWNESGAPVGWRLKSPPTERRLAPVVQQPVDVMKWLLEGAAMAPKVEAKPKCRPSCDQRCPCDQAKPSAPVCHPWCGRKRDAYEAYVLTCSAHIPSFCVGLNKGIRFCSSDCRDAGRPLNPAVKPLEARVIEAVEREVKRLDALAPCTKCAHRHIGPCGGTSPNGEYGCPCGHVAAKAKGTRVVGAYGPFDSKGESDPWTRMKMNTRDLAVDATATLLANLTREKPPERVWPKVAKWYAPGVMLDE